MKRIAMLAAVIGIATWTGAQTPSNTPQTSQPSAPQTSQPAPQGAQSGQPAGATTAPQPKRPPQTSTTPEYEAWQAVDASSRPTAEEQAAAQKNPADAQKLMSTIAERTEKGAEDFAVKFPTSEVRVLL